MVDLPAPLAPTIATRRPGGTLNDTSSKIVRRGSYAKVTCSNVTAPGPGASGGAFGASRTSAATRSRLNICSMSVSACLTSRYTKPN